MDPEADPGNEIPDPRADSNIWKGINFKDYKDVHFFVHAYTFPPFMEFGGSPKQGLGWGQRGRGLGPPPPPPPESPSLDPPLDHQYDPFLTSRIRP